MSRILCITFCHATNLHKVSTDAMRHTASPKPPPVCCRMEPCAWKGAARMAKPPRTTNCGHNFCGVTQFASAPYRRPRNSRVHRSLRLSPGAQWVLCNWRVAGIVLAARFCKQRSVRFRGTSAAPCCMVTRARTDRQALYAHVRHAHAWFPCRAIQPRHGATAGNPMPWHTCPTCFSLPKII